MNAAHTTIGFGIRSFFSYAKSLYAAALGIEILCIAAAEIGENTGLYLFGFNASGIAIAYAMGYVLAGFTTFVTILGRYDNQVQPYLVWLYPPCITMVNSYR